MTREQLQSIEWAIKDEDGGSWCPACASPADTGHKCDCWLARALAAPPAAGAPPALVALVQRAQKAFKASQSSTTGHTLGDWTDALADLLAWSPAPVARKPFTMNVSREWVMRMAEIEAETLGSPVPAPATASRIETCVVCDGPVVDAPGHQACVAGRYDAVVCGPCRAELAAPAPPAPDVVDGQCPRCGERDSSHVADCRHWTCDHCGHDREAHRDGVASRLERDGQFHPCKAEQAHGYLSRVFTHHAPQCTPLPDLLGVCTQVDNLLAGLAGASPERCGYVHKDGWTCGRAKGHPSVHVPPSRMANPPAPVAPPAEHLDDYWIGQRQDAYLTAPPVDPALPAVAGGDAPEEGPGKPPISVQPGDIVQLCPTLWDRVERVDETFAYARGQRYELAWIYAIYREPLWRRRQEGQ